MTWKNQNYYFTRTNLYCTRQFWINMKHAKRSTDIKTTPGSVIRNVITSWFHPSGISVVPSTCTRINSFPNSEEVAHKALWEPSSLLRESTQICKSTTVMTVLLTHYMKLNAIKTFSFSVKACNRCSLQINCIANYKITNKNKLQTRELFLYRIQWLMAASCSQFLPWPKHTQTTLPHNLMGNTQFWVMNAHSTDRRKNINCSVK